MCREIKFRAWDKTTKKIYEVDSLNFRNEDLWLELDENKVIGANFFEVELMQYTGLKDINGTEVYEGDIIESPLWEAEPYEIVFKDYAFKARDINKKIRHGSDLFFTLNDLLSGCVGETFEVIGNIYENPELLRGEE